MNGWPNYLIFVVVGYAVLSRSFAYLGVPPLKIFIGEISIAAFLVSYPRAVFDRWLYALGRQNVLTGFAVTLLTLMLYGLVEVARGLDHGYRSIIILQSFAFQYYPICFFIGLWAGLREPVVLQRLIRILAWVNGVYGLLFILVLNHYGLLIPGTSDVPLFGQPVGATLAILGLVCFERRLAQVWHLLLLNALVMLGLLMRAEYLGCTLGLIVWALLARRFGRLVLLFAGLALLLAVGLVTDFDMPAPLSRGGHISAKGIAGRMIAPFDADAAAQLTASNADAKSEAGTAEWRTRWWKAIWETVHENADSTLFGLGYGYPIANLVGYGQRDLRTPHSVFFYCLAYGGWVGVFLFAALQTALVGLMWRAWRTTGNPFGLSIWAAFLCSALLGNLLETPFGAIPFYLITGLAAAPILAEVYGYANTDGAQLLSAARG
jgi:hypothetical protein